MKNEIISFKEPFKLTDQIKINKIEFGENNLHSMNITVSGFLVRDQIEKIIIDKLGQDSNPKLRHDLADIIDLNRKMRASKIKKNMSCWEM